MEIRYVFLDTETQDLSAAQNPNIPVWCVAYIFADRQGCKIEEGVATLAEIKEKHKFIHNVRYVFHNSSFDVAVLRLRGFNIQPGTYDDTMVMSHMLSPSGSQNHKLDTLAKRWLGRRKGDYRQQCIDRGLLADKAPKGAEFLLGDSELLREYALLDVQLTFELYWKLKQELACIPGATQVYQEAFLPFGEGIMQMQQGVYIDTSKLYQFLISQAQVVNTIKDQLLAIFPTVPDMKWDKLTGGYVQKGKRVETNLDSDYHRIYILMQVGWVPSEFTAQGQPRCGVDHLIEQLTNHPVIDLLYKYQKATAAVSQALQILEKVNTKGLLRPSWHLCNTRTHRLSSSKPNCQNIGSAERDIKNQPLREAFCPSKGATFVNVDFSRIEVVMLAIMLKRAGDQRLWQAICDGKDVHQANADIWGVSRPEAKNGIFAVTYGASGKRLAATVHIPVEDAERIIDAINENTPLIDVLKQETRRELMKTIPETLCSETGSKIQYGQVRDLFGSVYHYPEIRGSDSARALRQAFNVKCQGSVGYLICYLYGRFFPYTLSHKARLVLQVHDELVFEVPDANVEAFMYDLDKTFNCTMLDTPIRCAIGAGKNWHESKSGGK